MSPGSVQEVEMGVKVSKYPVERYKATDSRMDLITLLHKNPIAVKSHYSGDIGFRFNYLDEAVAMGIKTDIHYGFLIVQWDSNAAGTAVVSNNYSIKVLSLAQSNYDKFVRKYNLNGDLTKQMLQICCSKGKEQYQDLEVEVAGKAPYLVNPDGKVLFESLKKDIAANKHYVPLLMAEPLTSERFRQLISGDSDSSADDKQFEQTQRVSADQTQQASVIGGPQQNNVLKAAASPEQPLSPVDNSNVEDAVVEANKIATEGTDADFSFDS